MTQPDFLKNLETLIQNLQADSDPRALARTQQIVQALMDFHCTALARMAEELGKKDPAILPSLAADSLISSALLLHGLHPVSFEARVGQALDKARPFLHSHGGDVELLSVDDGMIRLRLLGSCHGCPSSAITLKQTIEEAINELAPDAAGMEIEEHPSDAGDSAMPSFEAGSKSSLALPILAG